MSSMHGIGASLKSFAAALVVWAAASHASAVTITGDDFDVVQLRSANSVVPPASPLYGTAIEDEIEGTAGAYVQTTEAGQKVYFGTTALGGVKVGDISAISFTYAYKPAEGNNEPYTNIIVTNGVSTGMIAAITSTTTDLGTITYDGDTYNARRVEISLSTSTLKFYEPSGAPSWAHGTTLNDDDLETLSSWEISNTRPLSAGEANSYGDPRGPVAHGFSINWGDSASNYLGERLIYDVAVVVPEPASLALVALGSLAVLSRRRTA